MASALGVAGALLVGGAALAAPVDRDRDRNFHEERGGRSWWHLRHTAPEFDPAAVGAIATLLAGGGLLIVSRRSRSK